MKPPSNIPTVAILYGFCEGPGVSRHFREQLAKAGYRVIPDATQADIIIGHSGGCFLLPDAIRATRIIHIGIPFWPGRSMASSIWHKFVTDLTSHHKEGALLFWIRKTLWNLLYFWNMPANIRMLRGRSRGSLWKHGVITTVVRPSLDTFCTPDYTALPFAGKPRLAAVPGHHDEIWHKPAPYIAIVQS